MDPRPLGATGLRVTPLGFGAFKIGRNQGVRYAQGYALPNDAEAQRLLLEVVSLGVNYVDTAPAYGLSEERVGRALGERTDIVISTKVGETFEDGRSTYDFSAAAIRASVERSRQRLRRDALDLVFIHAHGDDMAILHDSDAVPVLRELRERGAVRAIGLSGKTVAAARLALDWADALMVEYHEQDVSHAEVMNEAAARGVGVVVKKGLASGRLPAERAIPFVLSHAAVGSLVVGGLNLEHFRGNVRRAERVVAGLRRPEAR